MANRAKGDRTWWKRRKAGGTMTKFKLVLAGSKAHKPKPVTLAKNA